MSRSIGERTRVGVFWNGLTTGVAQIVSFAMGIVRARLLLPEHFGIVASVLIFTEVGHAIVTSGIVIALIQRTKLSEGHYATAFTIQTAAAGVLYVLLAAASPWVGLFLRTPLSGQVLAVMALSVLILPFISTPTALLRKQMDFRAIGVTDIAQELSAGVTSVILALLGWGVWSLVFGRLIGYAIKALHLAFRSGWRPRLRFCWREGKELVPFSLKVVAVNVLNGVASNVGYFMVGRLLGPTQLGFYHRAYYLLTLPLNRLTEPLNTVFFSAFSHVHEDVAALKEVFLKAVYYVALVACPILTGLFWIAPTFVHVVYGEKWMPSVLPLQIMCLAGILLSVEPIAVSAITARGYVGWEVRRQLLYVALLLIGIFVGSSWGIVGVSSAVLGVSVILPLILQHLLARSVRLSWADCGKVFMPTLMASGVMSLALWGYREAVRALLEPYSILMLVTSILVGCLAYGTSFVVMGPRMNNKMVNQMFREFRSLRHKAHRLLQVY